MIIKILFFILLNVSTFALVLADSENKPSENNDDDNIEIIVIEGQVAYKRPAGTYASPATELLFDPLTELQSRGLPEGQADVTVRGGLFENTGFKIGAISIMDPQTGHYVAELPVDPALLSSPEILLGIDNTLAGFNSNITTIAYKPTRIKDEGMFLIGFGNDSLQYQSLLQANKLDNNLGLVLSLAQSDGDGTLPNGDHKFQRFNIHLQHSNQNTQSDLIVGYQDKFYGWPGAYTGFASLAETDHTKTKLLLANHRQDLSNGYWEVGGFYRRLDDDYDFNRTTQETGTTGSFDHITRVYGIGLQGQYAVDGIEWDYAGQIISDELVYSTDLTAGEFNSRNYGSLSLIPAISIRGSNYPDIRLRLGGNIDWSNEDGSIFSPVFSVSMNNIGNSGSSFLTLEYASSSQLPGYTALKSPPSGLFGGNADLGYERAKQLSLSLGHYSSSWNGKITLFYRQDDDLVDWTYASSEPFSRQANSVVLDVLGLETIYKHHWDSSDLIAGYTFLEKDSDYGSTIIDASFYALNFARHRATLALHYHIMKQFELRLHTEYRVQEENPLRASSDKAFLMSVDFSWEPFNKKGLGISLKVDNLTDNDYQQFPGTPAIGRQISLSAKYLW